MKTLHFDCFAGISGDMTLGALVDVGVDPDALRRELGKLGLPGWKLEFRRDERGGIHGVHAVALLDGQTDHVAIDGHDGDHHHAHEHSHDHNGDHHHEHKHSHEHSGDHHHDHEHSHDHGGDHQHEHEHSRDHSGDHHHDHEHSGDHQHEHKHGHDHNGDHHHEHEHGHHAHTTWKEIRTLIESSGISAGAKKRALAIFQRIADAEAQVHGSSADEVAFHEVGALDSIIDIVGAAVCLDMLGPERITCGEVELGGGMVRCAHGVLPVPAPATAILVRGMPVSSGGFNREMTTPTGAAILAASVDEFITAERYREIKSGYGIGTRKMEKPNLLRVSWRETDASGGNAHNNQPWQTEELFLLEAAIDDMSGEALGFFMETLFAAGALDVTMVPCVMKKSRPGTIVSALAAAATLDTLRRTFFERSATIGFREIPVRRLSLRRETETLRGAWGEARRKLVFLDTDGKALRGKIEYEDRARLARERGISLDETERLIMSEGGT